LSMSPMGMGRVKLLLTDSRNQLDMDPSDSMNQ
jgi:hypothetical protein